MLTKNRGIIFKLLEKFVIYFGALDGCICSVYSFPKRTVLIEEYFLSHGGFALCCPMNHAACETPKLSSNKPFSPPQVFNNTF